MHSSNTDVTAAALARCESARKRAIWADDFVALNADRRDRTRMEMREIRADLSTNSARAELALLVADVPLLAAIASAAVRLVEVDPRWWWLGGDDDEYRCISCGGNGGYPVKVAHAPNCPALALDAAIRAAGEAGQ